MDDLYGIHETLTPAEKVTEMRRGANWFFWVAILASLNAIVSVYTGMFGFALGFGISKYVDVQATIAAGPAGDDSVRWTGAAINILIAAGFALFGYFARKGSDIAFIVGMFLYVVDAMLILAYRDNFGFAFHLLALFYMFKGLLGSRKRYDPSV